MEDDEFPQFELLIYTSVYLEEEIDWDFLQLHLPTEEEECSSAPYLQLQEELPAVISARDSEEQVLDPDAQLELEIMKQMEALGLPTAFSTTSKFAEQPVKVKRKKVKTKRPKGPAKCTQLETIKSTVSTSFSKFAPSGGNKQRKNDEEYITQGVAKAVLDSKYWRQRYSLFSKFDEGVQMDEEGMFSVTPEVIARHQASRCKPGVILDGFTGVGGNAIQFALMGHPVVAVDIDPEKIKFARHNAKIYGVEHSITFIVGDFFEVGPTVDADIVFLSPPWGGPDYAKASIFNLNMLKPKDGYTLFETAQHIAPDVILFLPRNVNVHELAGLVHISDPPTRCEVERNYLNGYLKAITAYYGGFPE